MATATGIKCSLKQNNFQKEVNKRPDARLSANSLFRNVSEESIARILVCSGAKFRTYKKDETIFRQGEQADYFYALLKGNVSIISYMPSGKVNALYHVASGALIGEHYSSNLDTNGRVYW